ncbi:hypothetical protein [Dictyobacter arantiisoli]|uniref:Uncharacterized protein n=1 Tax=Dictyobacter arantiisoli TaxID=2014874 RepID=A0A5A5TGF5_9CHLR|nr:hypothetical protein [Dictyobacter arantiisoli]GCF10325.1 hypothetical protein KDI_38890 [Dictyobacter arantiisoli]
MQRLKRSRVSHVRLSSHHTRGSRRFSPFVYLGSLCSLILLVGAGIYLFIQPTLGSHAQGNKAKAVNGACTLIVPPNPLTAQGLATPYRLVATDRGQGACRESNIKQQAFVQGAIFDPQTNQISIYNPLVIDKGDQPAIAPVVPNLPQNAIVGLWFGFNGTDLTLAGSYQNLQVSNCVNGLRGSDFGQVAFCNATAFYKAANQAIQAGKLVVPALGTGNDGMTCPSVRDFSLIDQDQSDNVNSDYLLDRQTGRLAQHTAANTALLPQATVVTNGSDNRLLAVALDNALGCKPWTAPDLADAGHSVTAQPLDELQAAAHQAAPMALVPNNDPMVVVNGKADLSKLNLYRASVNQAQVASRADASTATYCQNLLNTAPQRIFADRAYTQLQPSADVMLANNLFTFLAQRFNTSWGANGLNCQHILGIKSPIKLSTDGAITVDASLRTASHTQGN